MHFLIIKILFPSVCATAVYEGVSRTDVTMILSRDPWPNDCVILSLRDLASSTVENSWTACKNKSTFINCEAEFSATLKPACVRLDREYANYFKF